MRRIGRLSIALFALILVSAVFISVWYATRERGKTETVEYTSKTAGSARRATIYLPPNYPSDMPAFAGVLKDDEIRAVLAYIKTYWKSPDVLAAREKMTRNERKR